MGTSYVKNVIGFTKMSQVTLVVAGGAPDPQTPLASYAPGTHMTRHDTWRKRKQASKTLYPRNSD